MNEVGATRLTPQAIQARAKAFAGPMLMGAPTLQCGKYRDAPAVCNDRSQFFRYKGKGQFARTATWLAPPA
jgi:branched-chain amino acid transport system substrate-binding protein